MAVVSVLWCSSAARSVLIQREKLSIVNVDWENSLLVYGQLALQVKINQKIGKARKGFNL